MEIHDFWFIESMLFLIAFGVSIIADAPLMVVGVFILYVLRTIQLYIVG
jgi:hypothetical protein